ncbi:MAG: phosphatidate cytidylyltransferase, partial [Planctomycetales bacterium]
MLRWRIPVAISILAVLFGVLYLDARFPATGLWFFALGVLVTLGCAHEFVGFLRSAKAPVQAGTVYLGTMLMVGANWLSGLPWTENATAWTGWIFPAAAFVLVLILATCVEIVRYDPPDKDDATDKENNDQQPASGVFLPSLTNTVFAAAYVGWLTTFILQLRWLGFGGAADGTCGLAAFASLAVVVKFGDTGAYFTGRFLGRHKLPSKVSPNKTIEGLIGGMVFSLGGAALALLWLAPWITGRTDWNLPVFAWVAFGIVVNAAGVMGDLAESLIKRAVGCKDSSTWL